MIKAFSRVLVVMVLCLGGVAHAAEPHEDALQAYNLGRYAAALEIWQPLAQQGDPAAQYWVGEHYYQGVAVAEDYPRALQWLKKAADQGNALALRRLGVMYELGYGIAKDPVRAVRCYQEAFPKIKHDAERGDSWSQMWLGMMLEMGDGAEKDPGAALLWYRKSAEQGNTVAQSLMGTVYQFGKGVARDDAEAVRWYRISAEKGYGQAQKNLGFMCLNGLGTPRDEAEALKWYSLAAEQKVAPSLSLDREQEKTLVMYRAIAEREGTKSRDSARLLLEEANVRWPDHAGLLMARIDLELSETRYYDALEYCEKLARKYPDNGAYQIRLLNALSRAHRDDDAYALYLKLAAEPRLRDRSFYEAARTVLGRAGKGDELARNWDLFAADYPDSIELLAYRAEKMADSKDAGEALALYRKLIAAELPPVERLAKYAAVVRKQSGTVAAAVELDAVARRFPGQFHPQFLTPKTAAPVPGKTLPLDNSPRLVAQVGHLGGINALALGPGGLMITAGSDGAAILWDLETGKELHRFVHPRPVRSARFLPHQASLMTGSDDGMIRIWSLPSGKRLQEIQTPAESVWTLEAVPDGSILLSGGGTNSLHIWDGATGKLQESLAGHRASINAIAVAPDARHVATASTDKSIIIWDLAKKSSVQTLYGHGDSVTALAFSEDGRLLVSAGRDATVRLWHLATGAEIGRIDLHRQALSLALIPGKSFQALVGTAGSATVLVDLDRCAEVREFAAPSAVRALAASADGRFFAAGETGGVEYTVIGTGRRSLRFSGEVTGRGPYLFSAQGNRFISGSADNGLWEWQVDSGVVRRIPGGAASRAWGAYRRDNTLNPSPDIPETAVVKSFPEQFAILGEGGAELRQAGGAAPAAFRSRLVTWGEPVTPAGSDLWLVGGENGDAYLVSAVTGAKGKRMVGHQGAIVATAVSSDGRLGATGGFDKTVIVWDLASGAAVRTFTGFRGAVVSLGFAPGTHLLAAGGAQQPVRLWEADSGRELPDLGSRSADTESLAFSPDGRLLLTAGSFYGMRLWELSGRRELCRELSRGAANARDAGFSPDGKYLLVPGDDGGTTLVEAATGSNLARLFSFADGTWAVVDREGRYDASLGGKVAGLHWVLGTTPIELSQLKGRYYEPGLLAKTMGYNKEPLRNVAAFDAPKLFPEVTLSQPAMDQGVLQIALKDQGGGIGQVRVLVNGKEVVAGARGGKSDPAQAEPTFSVDLSAAPLIPGAENKVEVFAWNAEGYLSNRGKVFTVRAPAAKSVEPPEIYAIIAGVSRYENPSLNLNFSGKDASDMAQALRISAKRLFGVEKVHLALLADYADGAKAPSDSHSDSQGVTQLPPSRENLEKAFRDARKSRPTDILVVYLAGHGVMTAGEAADYHYLTKEAGSTELGELSDPEARKKVSVSSAELTEWIKAIPALKQVMILDTCAAGGAAVKLMKKRNLSSDQIRSLERLKDRTGFHVLMGAAADKSSLEATQYGQGLLTYAILEGMKGAALSEGEFVDVQKLFQHAANRVPELARSLGGIQRPEVASPGGTSFEIGQVTAEDKERIPLARVKPLVLRSNFTTAARPVDSLGLTRLVNAELRELSALGRGARVVYVDTDELPGAYTLSGRYRKAGDALSVEAYLFEGEMERSNFTVEGRDADLPGLAKSLVAKAMEEIAVTAAGAAKEKR